MTPAAGVLIGIAFLVAAAAGGQWVLGVSSLLIMVVFVGAAQVAARHSETTRALLDRGDERIVSIDLRASAATAIAMILAVLAGALVSLARGGDAMPYALIGAVGGVAYLGAVVVLARRG